MSQLRQPGDYLKDNKSNKCYHHAYTGTIKNKLNKNNSDLLRVSFKLHPSDRTQLPDQNQKRKDV